MQIKTFPYEFMARWKDGVFSDYHIITQTIACDDTTSGLPLRNEDGSLVLGTFGTPQTLTSAGIDISALLTEGLSDALKNLDAANAQITALKLQVSTLTKQATLPPSPVAPVAPPVL